MAVTANLECDKCGKTYKLKHAYITHIEKCTKHRKPAPLIREDSFSRALNTDNDVVESVPIELYNMHGDEEFNFFPTAFDELIGLNESDVSNYAIYPKIVNVEDINDEQHEEVVELLTTAQKFIQTYLNPTNVTIAPSVRACVEAATFLEKNPETSLVLSASQRIPVLPEPDWETVLNKSKDLSDHDDSIIETNPNTGSLMAEASKVLTHDTYKCDVCDNRFSTLEELNDHMSRKHEVNIYKCDVCDNKFSSIEDLNDHMSREHAVHKFKCDVCPNLFSERANMQAHMVKIHKDILIKTCITRAKAPFDKKFIVGPNI